MNEVKLLSCPFCDSRAFIRQNKDVMKTYSAYCGNEDCPVSPKVSAYAKETVIKLWNTRKPMQKIVERLEEVKTKTFVSGITFNPYEFGCCHAMDKSIEIIKKEGRLDD